MTENNNFLQSTENHRFRLAVLFVAGFFTVISVGLLGEIFGTFAGLKELAVIFSGWITAVIGFYFLQQNNEQAWRQARDSATDATEARKTSERVAEKTSRFASTGDGVIAELGQTLREKDSTIQKQEKIINRLSEIVLDYKKLIDELTGEPEGITE